MCGIAGTIEPTAYENISFDLNGLVHKSIGRRGPDNYNNVKIALDDYTLYLAHSRLSIIDLTNASDQPLLSEDSRYYIVFNGEIYNYIELRDDLKALGYIFKTQGDTEVLLYAWIHWGEECLNRLNGMFAFCVFDSLENICTIVRDRFGIKPLLFSFNGTNRFYFSSSVEGLQQIVKSDLDLNYISSGYHFGVFEGIDNSTCYSKIKYVPAGSLMRIKINCGRINIDEKKWYNLFKQVELKKHEISNINDAELITLIRDTFDSSISLRLRSDVPLAVSLSGGVDSSLVSSLAHKKNVGIEGYTYGIPGKNKSEGNLVSEFARFHGLKVNYIWSENDKNAVVDAYESTLSAQELPFFRLSVIAQNLVYKAVKTNGVKVLLGGQGGDEIFGGYRKFFIQALSDSVNNNKVVDSLYFMYSTGRMLIGELNRISLFWRLRDRYFSTVYNSPNTGLSFLNRSNFSLLNAKNQTLSDAQILDVTQNSLPTLLRIEDKNSMYHSIESRLPFMDYRLVELAIALPHHLKIKSGYGKWILREIGKDQAPANIIWNRNKRGFDVTQDWMNMGLKDHILTRILDNRNKFKKLDFNLSDSFVQTILNKNHLERDQDLLLLDFLTFKL